MGKIYRIPPNYTQAVQPTQDKQTRYLKATHSIKNKQHDHKLAKGIAKILISLLGTISSVHIEN